MKEDNNNNNNTNHNNSRTRKTKAEWVQMFKDSPKDLYLLGLMDFSQLSEEEQKGGDLYSYQDLLNEVDPIYFNEEEEEEEDEEAPTSLTDEKKVGLAETDDVDHDHVLCKLMTRSVDLGGVGADDLRYDTPAEVILSILPPSIPKDMAATLLVTPEPDEQFVVETEDVASGGLETGNLKKGRSKKGRKGISEDPMGLMSSRNETWEEELSILAEFDL